MIFSLKINLKSKVYEALMYMQHRHMACGEFQKCHDLVLDQNINDNSHSPPYHHEALDVDHKIVMVGIDLYYNIFSLLFVQYQHYPEHDTLYLSIFFYCAFFCILPDQ